MLSLEFLKVIVFFLIVSDYIDTVIRHSGSLLGFLFICFWLPRMPWANSSDSSKYATLVPAPLLAHSRTVFFRTQYMLPFGAFVFPPCYTGFLQSIDKPKMQQLAPAVILLIAEIADPWHDAACLSDGYSTQLATRNWKYNKCINIYFFCMLRCCWFTSSLFVLQSDKKSRLAKRFTFLDSAW